jgi:DNA-binding phage protein
LLRNVIYALTSRSFLEYAIANGGKAMEVIEYIKQTMKEEGVTQMELGRRTGLTRQSVFDVLTRANPNFNTVRRIFNALDRDIDIRKKDGSELDIDKNSLYAVFEREAPGFGKLKAILEAMGYEFQYVRK